MPTPLCLLGGPGIEDRTGHGHDQDRFVEIGSLSKVFTGTVLGRLAQDGTVGLDTPLEDCLAEVPGGTGISLRHLAEHTSGLPRLPDVLAGPHGDPYAAFTPHALDACLGELDRVASGELGVAEYSNLGYAVLGRALTAVTGQPYQRLLDDHVLRPLGLAAGAVTAEPPQGQRLVPRGLLGRPKPLWTLTGPIAPAGGLWATCRTLARATVGLLVEHRLGEPALTWQYGSGVRWHNGATRGSSVLAAAHDDGRWIVLHRLGDAAATDRLARQTLLAAPEPRGRS
ncbi:serine hydrolase domain-containing protein [Streptomyces sp. NPDC001941]|uniref:serine hydrolase domain-containing protein n=1 Tax=Streptomyces sp. NPDC001941 TaxID=3154659 RepID=UPI00332B5E0E